MRPIFGRILMIVVAPDEIPEQIPDIHVISLVFPEELAVAAIFIRVPRCGVKRIVFRAWVVVAAREFAGFAILSAANVLAHECESCRMMLIHRGLLFAADHNECVCRKSEK